jgi:hypothetical protein
MSVLEGGDTNWLLSRLENVIIGEGDGDCIWRLCLRMVCEFLDMEEESTYNIGSI